MRPRLASLTFVSHVRLPHLKLLLKLRERCEGCPQVTDLLALRARHAMQFWELGDARALVLTTIEESPSGLSLLVYGTVGHGIIRQMKQVVADLKLIAAQFGCASVTGRPARKGWSRTRLDQLGFRPTADLMTLELT